MAFSPQPHSVRPQECTIVEIPQQDKPRPEFRERATYRLNRDGSPYEGMRCRPSYREQSGLGRTRFPTKSVVSIHETHCKMLPRAVNTTSTSPPSQFRRRKFPCVQGIEAAYAGAGTDKSNL